ncbi:MAG: hypothetical protein Q9222_003809 [Ikaeria aurantiellina]
MTFLLLLTIPLLLILPFYTIYKPPSLLIHYFQYQYPDVLFHVPNIGSKVVALTIDDAPSEYTDEILQVLLEHGAKATFFIIGSQVKGRDEVLRKLVEEGMELGNHAMFDEASRSLSSETLVQQIQAAEGMINDTYAAVGQSKSKPPKYFRPGSGFFTERIRDVVYSLGYRLVLGSIYPHDAQTPFWRLNAWHILSKLKPGGIVICHDRRKWTAPMLRRVLPEMKRRGYRIVSLSGLIEAEKDSRANG